ncbi:Zinc finger protein gcs1 [Aspergillus sp. HF37]|nr:Zinc finger protein gcs1 [Aspergillus sp. HF37]
MSRMWEVDPETRTKLTQISKSNGNDKCCDCGAPAPQWASPKFGTFICLNCAGIHRGLGVHISFVRSITMDAFKTAEIQRMDSGGNDPWRTFFDAHPLTQAEGRTFEDSTIKERYEGDVGDEWKERLSAKKEKPKKTPAAAAAAVTGEDAASRSSTPLSGGSSSMEGFGFDPKDTSTATTGPGAGPGPGTKKDRNEAYFAKLGSDNATRSESLPPSQGGKFTGFGGGGGGGGGMPQRTNSSASLSSGQRRSQLGQTPLAFDEFQKDPVTSLSKGFGWFASAVGKGAKSVNDSYIQPTAKTIAESDFAAQARVQATSVGQNIQVGARGAADSFNRFVEGEGHDDEAARGRGPAPERKDFWDDFAALGAPQSDLDSQSQSQSHHRTTSRSSAIGTAAMRKAPPGPVPSSTAAGAGAGPGAGPGATGNTASGTTSGGKGQEDWGDDNW